MLFVIYLLGFYTFTNAGGGGCHDKEKIALDDLPADYAQEDYAQKEKVRLTPNLELNNDHFPNEWNGYLTDNSLPQNIYLFAALSNGGGGGPKKQMSSDKFQHNYQIDELADMAVNNFISYEILNNHQLSKQWIDAVTAIQAKNSGYWDIVQYGVTDNFNIEGGREANNFLQYPFNNFQLNFGRQTSANEQVYLAIQKASGMMKIPKSNMDCFIQNIQTEL